MHPKQSGETLTDQFPPQPDQPLGQQGQYGQQFPPPPGQFPQQPQYPPTGQQSPYGYQQPQPPYSPQQQSWQGGQLQPPPRKPHRKRNIWLGVLAALIVLGIIGSLTGGSKDASSSSTAAAVSPAPAAATTAPATTAPKANPLSPRDRRYISSVTSRFPDVTGSTGTFIAVGNSTCQARRDGASQAAVTVVAESKFGHVAGRYVRLTEKDLCAAELPKKPAVIASFSGSGIENTARFTVTGDWTLKWSYDCSGFGDTGNFIVDEDGGGDFSGANVNELGPGGHGETHVYNDSGRHYLSMNSECSWTAKVVS
jgi:hypothetical protein